MTVTEQSPLTDTELKNLDAYWRAANYLSVGQIYLLGENPLLREPLRPEQIKPRLLGHWGTTPGLNLIYAHVNRLIQARDLNMLYVTGPGHGGPGIVANTYLEGTYSELYPNITQDESGMGLLFRQFSFPGGIPSHAAPETPGSIHEGGELGYSLAHAYGAVFDNPDLIAVCVVGDGEAETGPLATSWHSNKFLNAAQDGAVLPILHLNGWKIANPTVLARIPDEELDSLLDGLRLPGLPGGRRRPGPGAPAAGRHAGRGGRRDRGHPAPRPRRRRPDPAALADDRAADAQGLDRPQGRRRPAGGGHLAGPPGAAHRGAHQPRAPAPARGVDAQLPAGGTVRPGRDAGPGSGRAGPGRRAPHERQPPHQRRPAPPGPGPARLPRLRRPGQGGHRGHRGRPRCSAAGCGT